MSTPISSSATEQQVGALLETGNAVRQASLTDQAEQLRNGQRLPTVPAPPAPTVDQSNTEPAPPADREVIDLTRAALAATDRINEMVHVLGALVDNTAADLAALRRATETALAATNDRLAALERMLSPSPPGTPAKPGPVPTTRRRKPRLPPGPGS